MFVDGAAGHRNPATGMWAVGLGVTVDCADSGLHVRLRRPGEPAAGSTAAEWQAMRVGLDLARALGLARLALRSDSRTVVEAGERARAAA